MKKLLITGFEPFGEDERNSSWDAVSLLKDNIGEYTVEKLLLPVVFGSAAEKVIKKAEETDACAVICVGQAGNRSKICVECDAVNLRRARIPDNDGNFPQDEAILAGGEERLFSTYDGEALVRAISAAGADAELSHDAGLYVCNDVLYSVLAHFKDSGKLCGFIHVPYYDEIGPEGKPSMPLCDIVRALEAAIEAL